MGVSLFGGNGANVKLKCQSCYVTNPGGILSASAEHQLNEAIGRLEAETAVEVAVVVVQTIDTDDCYDFAYRLFNHWVLANPAETTVCWCFLWQTNVQ